MKIRKTGKRLAALLTFILAMAALWGCGSKTPEEKVSMNIAGLKGPTSIGMLKMLEDRKSMESGLSYEFHMYTSADEMVPKLVNKEIDIAAIPANLASVLYKKTEGGIRVIDINTLGVLYVLENGTAIESFSDLKGKTIYMTGKGIVPEYTIHYLLDANGMTKDDVKIEFKSEPTEVVSALAEGAGAIGILPQPFVTVAMAQNQDLRITLDLTEEWDKIKGEEGGSLITGVTIVREEFLREHPAAVKTFLEEHYTSAAYINENPSDGAALVEAYDIVKAAVAEKAIPYCNITCITGEEMRTKLSGYLKALYQENQESVGGELPDDEFYYIPE